jgi:hypothetical protein
MKLMSVLLFSGVVALSSACAMAQDTAPAAPAQAQAAPQGGPRGGPPGGPQGERRGGPPGRTGPVERAPPSTGGTVGTVESVSATGFVISTAVDRKATIETTSATTYRKGKSASSTGAVKPGDRILAIGLVTVGRGGAETTVKADQVTVQPVGLDGATKAQVGAVRGGPPVAKEVGKVPANYVQGEGTIISGAEATKAIEAGLAAWTGGYVNRVVKLKSGEYEVHQVGVDWPHHIFIDQNFKYLGAQ